MDRYETLDNRKWAAMWKLVSNGETGKAHDVGRDWRQWWVRQRTALALCPVTPTEYWELPTVWEKT